MRLSSFILAGTILLSCISCGNNRSEETVMKEGNPVIENIMARRSIRKYKAEPVSRATMDTILMCGINAPNGMNRQSWEVRVVDKPEVMAEIKEYMKAANPDVKPEMIEGCFRGAPTMVFVANDPAYDFSAIDCGLLSENIMLSDRKSVV